MFLMLVNNNSMITMMITIFIMMMSSVRVVIDYNDKYDKDDIKSTGFHFFLDFHKP